MTELQIATNALARHLRQYFVPYGNPPQLPHWQIPCSEAEHANHDHPLKGFTNRFEWLIGDPDKDQLLMGALEKFEILRKTSALLKRVQLLVETKQCSAHYRIVWQRLLVAQCLHCVSLSYLEGTAGPDGPVVDRQFFAGAFSAAVDQQMVADLIEASHVGRTGKRKKQQGKSGTAQLSELQKAAKRLREEPMPNGAQRSFGQIADELNVMGFKKRDGSPHDYDSAKAAYGAAVNKR